MGKGKLAKFADMDRYENVFQYPFSVIRDGEFDMKGRWHEDYFQNDGPIVVELGCGKGEYTVELARLSPTPTSLALTSRERACGPAPRKR